VEQCGRGEVHADSRERDDQNDSTAHVGRIDQAPNRRVDDHDADDEERDPVHVGGEDLEPAEAERPAASRRPEREGRSDQREPEGRGVGEHVPRVRKQRERAGDDAECDLPCHQPDDQRQRERQPTPAVE
jgi:hypothetical protein